jgi:secreted trypsin-like serine protease
MRLGGLAVICLLMLPATAEAAASPRVVGGKAVPEGKYPAIANVNIAGAFGCSGTLVAPDWVLTAGHCGSLTSEIIATPIAFPAALITVTLGTVRTNGAGGTVRGVSEIRIPSGHFALSVDTGYDISLLHLSSPAPQQPMLVAGKGEEPLWAPGHMETVAGFGITSETGSPPPVMQEANVPIVDDAKCLEANPDIFEPVTQICAGFPQGGVDTCNGDSGGPMFTQSPAGGLRIVGTTSYGQGCARPNQYGVYARVGDATLREWIRSIAPAAVAPDYVAPPPKPAPEPKPKKKHKKKKHKKHKKPAKKHK